MNHWRPASDPATAARRAKLLQRARDYFQRENVVAVDTPALSPTTVTDPNIDSLSLDATPLYLQTSPECHMKRLLAAGYPDIYAICRVFRGNESGHRHLPEFTMIEWYRLGMRLQEIIDDTLALLAAMLGDDFQLAATQFDYAELFNGVLAIDPFTATPDELATAADADESLRAALGDDRNAWLDLLLATRIASTFDSQRPTVVRHYPAAQAALSRLCPNDARVADRFEIFWGSLELANGYVELTDAKEQQRRMQQDLAERARRGLAAVPHDETLLDALAAGLPECAGVALGFERVHMVAAGSDDIRNVVSFAE